MSNRNNETRYVASGTSFSVLLSVLFIGLKLSNVINWRWIWVLSPIWIPVAVSFVVFAILLIGALIEDKRNQNKSKDRSFPTINT